MLLAKYLMFTLTFYVALPSNTKEQECQYIMLALRGCRCCSPIVQQAQYVTLSQSMTMMNIISW